MSNVERMARQIAAAEGIPWENRGERHKPRQHRRAFVWATRSFSREAEVSEPKMHEAQLLVGTDDQPLLIRIAVPGGWIYRGDGFAVFVPAPPDPPRPGE